MIKKQMPILIFICILILITLFVLLYSYQLTLQYKESTPPKITADSLKSLVVSLIKNEEFFVGSINVKYIDLAQSSDLNKAEIILRNNSTGDDSIGAVEYKILAEKKGQLWTITQYKSHWRCGRDFPNFFWTTKACS